MKNKETKHIISIGKSQNLENLKDKSIELVVTSPPYPMIEMWDEIFWKQSPEIKNAIDDNKGNFAFELMHLELDKVWREVERVLIPGGFACINIGDATRTLNGEFALYSNHSRIINAFLALGFINIPNIIWRKQTNAPNKFMGSGMLPAGAYVTLEHEWILIFRKGSKRNFKSETEKQERKRSSFFWEERNIWFSDLWDLKGTKQKINNSTTRERSGAYPFELPYRLINMYSLKGETVLDPFLGTGTTTIAAIASERNSVGYEIDPKLADIINANIENLDINELNLYTLNRIKQHKAFISERADDIKKNEIKHFNNCINLPVMTLQETELKLSTIQELKQNRINEYSVNYNEIKDVEGLNLPTKQIKNNQTSLGF